MRLDEGGDLTGPLVVVGGGLAGVEAAHAASSLGIDVLLLEMRPSKTTPAHTTGYLAELVCSNSFRSAAIGSAPGLLKAELEIAGSLLMRAARRTAVPAGKALAVDRTRFSREVTRIIEDDPRIEVIREEVKAVPKGPSIIASGPLTSRDLSEDLARTMGEDYLHFYDAIAPIVDASTIEREKVFAGSRYSDGDDYLNIPLSREEYEALVDALEKAPKAHLLPEDRRYFEGCLPIEELARRGRDTPRFGPMKPVGLGEGGHHAVIQLRREDLHGDYYNIVGFQTQIRLPEQERILRMIPGLRGARFIRFGSAHRNTYIDAPKVLDPLLRLKACPNIWIAGQLSGVEGYIESAASGLVAGIIAARGTMGLASIPPPSTTITGGLLKYITSTGRGPFVPMKANWGLVPGRKGEREAAAARAIEEITGWIEVHRRISDTDR